MNQRYIWQLKLSRPRLSPESMNENVTIFSIDFHTKLKLKIQIKSKKYAYVTK